ncbi:MAG: penicillin-binding protein 2 [Ignavibacteriae bacterium]|nr:penicillin-binding protein 2 [Ignavibacteria bacterium]MBI3363367.1 penicillin-binding protein 2 [Ignavibacteriota bacterium]
MENTESPKRRIAFIVAIGFMFIVLLGRLIQLQFLYQDVYGKKSEENSIRQIARDPIRGYIYDRRGTLLVDNRPSYTVTITPSEFKEKTIPYLAQVLGVDTAFVHERLRKGRIYNRFAPMKVKRDIDFPTLSLIEENRDKLSGVDYQIETKRFYPTKAKATHLFGYTKEISDAQLQELGSEYRLGDLIGATGLEAAYEHNLRGQKGYEFLTVNAKGQLLGAYNEGKSDFLAKEGSDLILAIDADLQALAESLLADKRGAVVAIDPNNGGVLALVSKPDYDLAKFGSVTSPDVWNALLTDSTKPMFNRATMTRYPPGSTFKMVLAAAALQEEVISPNYRIQCNGAFHYGTRVFKDHIAHGSTDPIESIQRSCNVFYYTVMLKTGLERWTRYGEEFGFGQPTGIDILEETAGLLPSEEYFDRIYGKGRWTQGYLVSLAIGQGEVGVSPLQMACYAAALGTRGIWHQPHVVERIRDKESGQTVEVKTETRNIELSDRVWNIIHEGMYRCVNEPGGTALIAKVRGVKVAGKTGTAQNPHGKDHAWFIGYAPVEHPKIAICVLVENAGFGGVIAAPIASMCIEQYLYGELIRNNANQPIVAAKDEQKQVEADQE